jgi:hypothetical protein
LTPSTGCAGRHSGGICDGEICGRSRKAKIGLCGRHGRNRFDGHAELPRRSTRSPATDIEGVCDGVVNARFESVVPQTHAGKILANGVAHHVDNLRRRRGA